jgi:uncharacterized protein (DUF2147 family)
MGRQAATGRRTAWQRPGGRGPALIRALLLGSLAVMVAVVAGRASVALGADQGAGAAGSAGDARDGAGGAADSILGNWLTQKRDGIIRIGRSADGHYEGRIVGGDSPGRLDSNNPDPARRGERLLGTTIMHDMKYDGDGRWSGGTIYDPESGHTYKCRLELRAHDQLRVRGFLGVSLLGRSQIWTRYLGSAMQLPAPAAAQ